MVKQVKQEVHRFQRQGEDCEPEIQETVNPRSLIVYAIEEA